MSPTQHIVGLKGANQMSGNNWLQLVPVSVPTILLTASMIARVGLIRDSKRLGSMTTVANLIGFGLSLVLLTATWDGTAIQPELPFGFSADALTALMLALITGLSAAIHRYSMRYLDGDENASSFFANLTLVAFGIASFVLASHLLVLFICWQVASYGLHLLLNHFKDRPEAQLAAREKFLISRLGDFFVLSAIGMTAYWTGTLDIAEACRALVAGDPNQRDAVAVLFVLGALTKSAQFPFHSWLPKTMEAPTTVSAFMHAGIINAGGFLMARLSPLIAHSTPALWLLFGVGTLTAILGSLSQQVQTDVKRKLAYSTIGQMGFMMLQCGLGAFAAAIFHLCAHGVYKATCFLSAGGRMDPDAGAAASRPLPKDVLKGTALWAVALLVSAGVVEISIRALGMDWDVKDGGRFLFLFYCLALTQLLYGFWSQASGPVVLRTVLFISACAGGMTVYLWAMHHLEVVLSPSNPDAAAYESNTPIGPGWLLGTGFIFTVLLWMSQFQLLSQRWVMMIRRGFFWEELKFAVRETFAQRKAIQ
jgi:NAD(P)H-quinone oxidoreductase subunit 5